MRPIRRRCSSQGAGSRLSPGAVDPVGVLEGRLRDAVLRAPSSLVAFMRVATFKRPPVRPFFDAGSDGRSAESAGRRRLVGVLAADVKVTLSGDKEVPAVILRAAGGGTITVGADRAISGSVKTSGV